MTLPKSCPLQKTTIVAEAVAQARPIEAKTQISRGLLWEKFLRKKWDVLVDPFPPSYVRSLVNLEANPDTDEILKVCGNLEEFEKANPDRVENKDTQPHQLSLIFYGFKYWRP